jgi:hypothetical protein
MHVLKSCTIIAHCKNHMHPVATCVLKENRSKTVDILKLELPPHDYDDHTKRMTVSLAGHPEESPA